jgi:hypothetical protein
MNNKRQMKKEKKRIARRKLLIPVESGREELAA